MMNGKVTNFLPKSNHPSKLENKDVQALVKIVNGKTGASQRRFGAHQSTISVALKNETTIKIYIRKSIPRYRNEN